MKNRQIAKLCLLSVNNEIKTKKRERESGNHRDNEEKQFTKWNTASQKLNIYLFNSLIQPTDRPN